MKKKLALIFAVASFVVPTVALAADVGGREWHYGVGYTGTYGYSNYYHETKKHSATVSSDTKTVTVTQKKDIWAKASITKIPPTGMNYYWKTF